MTGPDTAAIIAQALDNAPQHLFAAADVPIARTDELLAALTGPAVRGVMAMRIEQMVKHGHDAAHDAQLPLSKLPALARQSISEAIDVIDVGPERRNLKVARRRLERAAAILLAALDTLPAADAGTSTNEKGE